MSDSEIPFSDPHVAVKVRIIQSRSITSSSIWEKVWGNSEYFAQVCCEEADGPDEFYTKSFQRKKLMPINELFSFVFPENVTQNNGNASRSLNLKISLFKNGQLFGGQLIDVSQYEMQINNQSTLKFEKHQEVFHLDIEIEKVHVSKPDFRYSFEPSPEETQTAVKRKETVFKNIQSFLGDELGHISIEEVPTISVACSGGGYRSVMQFCGAMEAMKESGLFDCVTYMSALSGGAWYVLSAFTKKVFDDMDDLIDFHSEIKLAAKSSLLNALVDFAHYLKYRKYVRSKELEGQPITFVDFYGYTVGKAFLGPKFIDAKLSDLRSYAGSGEVPIPITTALHTRARESSATFHADLEITPWEASMPNYGINMSTERFGSEFFRGSMIRPCQEMPLHFYMGASSSAFGILLKYYLDGETSENASDFIADVRKHEFGRHNTKKKTARSKGKSAATKRGNFLSSSSDPDGGDIEQRRRRRSFSNRKSISMNSQEFGATERHLQTYMATAKRSISRERSRRSSGGSEYLTAEEDDAEILTHNLSADSAFESPEHLLRTTIRRQIGSGSENPTSKEKNVGAEQEAWLKKILKKVANHPLFTDREAVIDRTAKVLNCARGLSNTRYTPLNPKHTFAEQNGESSKHISTEEDIIAFVDAAIINNVPTSCLLRPQRKTDILIVYDATEYKSDTDIDYLELFIAERLAKQHGLKFPKIDPKKLKENPRGIVHVFEDKKDPECPILIWFTLSNREFKALHNVQQPPRRALDDAYRIPANEQFNVFSVFGSCYSTLNTKYTPLQFDRLRELMKYNVSCSMEVIKRQICKKVMQRRESRR